MWGCQTLALPSPPLQAQCMAQRPPWEGKARTKVYMYACVCVWGALCPGLGQGSAQPTQPDGSKHRPEALGTEGQGADYLISLSLSYSHLELGISSLAEKFWEMFKSETRWSTWHSVRHWARAQKMSVSSHPSALSCSSSPQEPVMETTRWNFSCKYCLLIKQEYDYWALVNNSHMELLNSCEDT